MRFFLFFLFFSFSFLIQFGALPHFSIFGISLDVLLISAFIFSFFLTSYQELIIYSFAAGFLLDVYSGVPFGIILLPFVLSVILIKFSAHNFLGRENIFVVCVGVAAGFLAYFIIYMGLLKTYSLFKNFPEMSVDILLFSKTAFFSIIFNTFGAAIFYLPLKKFVRFTDNFKR